MQGGEKKKHGKNCRKCKRVVQTELEKLLITWYPSRPLSLSSGTSSVKRLFCGGLAGAAGGGALGGAAADGGKDTGGRVCREKKKC